MTDMRRSGLKFLLLPADQAPMFQVPVQETVRRRGVFARLAVSVAVGLALVAGTTAGTWAAFSASTTNNASFATGTLILSNTVDELATCFSTAAEVAITSNDAACDKVAEVAAAVPTSGPADAPTESAAVTLRNEGTIDGSELELAPAGACSTSVSTGTGYNGVDADLCDDVLLMVQGYTSASNQENDIRTAGSCIYGLDALDDGACDGFDAGSNLDDFMSLATPISLGALPQAETRWFRVFLRLSSDASNSSQGLAAAFAMRWRTVQ